jgi:hypothetical protein
MTKALIAGTGKSTRDFIIIIFQYVPAGKPRTQLQKVNVKTL